MKRVKKLFLTAIALTSTGLLMKTVAVWFNVYVASKIQSSGMGLFQLILSVYAFAKTLSSAGIGLASTRLCIENENETKFTVRKMALFSILMGLFAFILLFSLSPFITDRFIGDERGIIALRILSLSLPFISLSTCLNGYMTAKRLLPRYSLIQLFEQFSRIAVTVIIVKYFFNSSQFALIGVCIGILASEIISFSLSYLSFSFDKLKYKNEKKINKAFYKKMLRILIPDALGANLRSALNTVEHLLIPIGIRKNGAGIEKSLSEYGAIQGMALPIVLYPSSVFSVISGLLVPEIAECSVKNNKKEINYIINRVLKLSLIFSFFVASFMFFYSDELSNIIYHSSESSYFILLLSPLIPIMYLDMTTDGMLKGLDEQLSIMRINILDSLICVIFVYFLVPKIAISGYIVTIYLAEIINFILSFKRLCKRAVIDLKLNKNIILPLCGSLLSFLLTKSALIKTNIPAIDFSLSIFAGIMIYYILLRISKSLTKEDCEWLKRLIRP